MNNEGGRLMKPPSARTFPAPLFSFQIYVCTDVENGLAELRFSCNPDGDGDDQCFAEAGGPNVEALHIHVSTERAPIPLHVVVPLNTEMSTMRSSAKLAELSVETTGVVPWGESHTRTDTQTHQWSGKQHCCFTWLLRASPCLRRILDLLLLVLGLASRAWTCFATRRASMAKQEVFGATSSASTGEWDSSTECACTAPCR